MTIIKEILNILNVNNDGLTTEEIHIKLTDSNISVKKENLWSYLSTLKKNGRIEIINDKKPYKYGLATTPLDALKQLYYLMGNLMEVKPDKKNEFIQNEKLITKIKEMIS